MSRKIESIEELHAYALRMLKFMDDVCRENGLTYFLSGGSVIGAVRHQGFIPWDDDADVMLPRADYERFLDVMERRAAEGRDAPYKVGSVRNRADWSFPFARIWDDSTRVVYHNLNEAPTGIFIDVYPMDGLPDGPGAGTKLHYLRVKLLHACLFASIRKRFKPGERFVPAEKAAGRLYAKDRPAQDLHAHRPHRRKAALRQRELCGLRRARALHGARALSPARLRPGRLHAF